jgi:Tannase and feruloyl esterase
MLGRIRARHAWALCVLALTAAGSLVVILGSAGGAAGAQSQQLVVDSAKLAATSPIIKPPNSDCAVITGLTDLAANPQYPTAIASSTDVPASSTNPEYCDVKGMIAPQTHFDLQLPVSTWQGRYLQNGCGGYCGTVSGQTFPSCDATLGGDFAMATDDEGHVTAAGLGGGGLWAFNDQKLRDEYGYESEQALYEVSREIIKDYYGVYPNESYFNGCSDGGREAMEMAERYPADFNGIIAGAPEIIAGPLNAENQTWDVRVNTDAQGNAILTDDKLPALHAAVLKFCAGDDGVSDGIITDPQDCDSKLPQILASVQCPAGVDDPSCLTPAQVTVAREIYDGPSDPQGRLLYPGGMPLGSEGNGVIPNGWALFELPPSQNGGSVPTTESLDYSGLSQPYLRYQLNRPGQLGPDPFQWQFTDQDFNSMFPAADTFDAMDTNLTAFYRHGGKLIIWQGWADNGIPPTGTVDYYDTLTQRMGRATTNFARLFLFPTVYHCGNSYAGATTPDLIYPMVQWVDQGTAPGTTQSPLTITYAPSGGTSFARPVYPYPYIPKYNGSGDPNSAASFSAVIAPAVAQGKDYTNWYGNNLFYRPIGGGDQGHSRRG